MANLFLIEGALNRHTVVKQLDKARGAIESGSAGFDLAGVTEVDSTALAFWIELQRFAGQQSSAALVWSNLPEQMKSIAQLVGLETIIND